MADKIYPKGIRVFPPRAGAPEWVLGTILLTPAELTAWLADNAQYLTDYKGNPQLRCQLLKGKDGPYITVDTYKAPEKAADESKAFNEMMDDGFKPNNDLPDGF